MPCGDVCAHVEDDPRHCGGCDISCLTGSEGCVGGSCVEGAPCEGVSCDGVCLDPAVYRNADHCGSCDNRCADDALCVAGVCVAGGGDGTTCGSPLFWDFAAEETAGFRMSPALSSEHTFQCGPLEPVRTRWFRLTATKDDETNIDVRSAGVDDYLLEVYSDVGCASEALLGCDDNADAPDPALEPPTSEGATYWIAVGVKPTWSGAPATLRGDH